MNNKISMTVAKISGAVAGLGALAFGFLSHAAVDTDYATATQSMLQSANDNLKSILITNLPLIAGIGIFILGVNVAWRFLKRFVGR